VAAAKTWINQPESLPPKTLGAVSFDRRPEALGQRKAYPIVGQLVLFYEKFRAPTANPPAIAKNVPNFVPSL